MAENTGNFLALLEKEQEQIAHYLPSYLRTDDERDRFFANARAVAADYKLKGCSATSLLNCVVDAAKRGLMIGGPEKHCAVVPFSTKGGGESAILITQWQGKSFLWQRAGAIKKLKAQVVYQGDEFALIEGDQDRIDHRPNFLAERDAKWLNDPKNVIGAYAIAWLPNGEKLHRFVSISQIRRTMEAVKKKNNGSLGFGWIDWFPEMCMKTAIHRLDGLIQPQPKMNAEQKEAWDLNERVVIEDIRQVDDNPDDIPTATDGTPAPTPRSVKVEVVPDKKKEDRLLTVAECDELYDSWMDLGGKRSTLEPFLKKTFSVSDLAELKASQVEAFTAAVNKEFTQ
jgi:phage RecT family recombinase